MLAPPITSMEIPRSSNALNTPTCAKTACEAAPESEPHTAAHHPRQAGEGWASPNLRESGVRPSTFGKPTSVRRIPLAVHSTQPLPRSNPFCVGISTSDSIRQRQDSRCRRNDDDVVSWRIQRLCPPWRQGWIGFINDISVSNSCLFSHSTTPGCCRPLSSSMSGRCRLDPNGDPRCALVECMVSPEVHQGRGQRRGKFAFWGRRMDGDYPRCCPQIGSNVRSYWCARSSVRRFCG